MGSGVRYEYAHPPLTRALDAVIEQCETEEKYLAFMTPLARTLICPRRSQDEPVKKGRGRTVMGS